MEPVRKYSDHRFLNLRNIRGQRSRQRNMKDLRSHLKDLMRWRKAIRVSDREGVMLHAGEKKSPKKIRPGEDLGANGIDK